MQGNATQRERDMIVSYEHFPKEGEGGYELIEQDIIKGSFSSSDAAIDAAMEHLNNYYFDVSNNERHLFRVRLVSNETGN